MIRSLEGMDGFGFFSSKHFLREDLKSLNNKLQRKYCTHPAIIPTMPWIDNEAPKAPVNLTIEGSTIRWYPVVEENEMDKARFFVVYRFELNEPRYLKHKDRIISITGENHMSFINGIPKGVYRVSALDRTNNESQLSTLLLVD